MTPKSVEMVDWDVVNDGDADSDYVSSCSDDRNENNATEGGGDDDGW